VGERRMRRTSVVELVVDKNAGKKLKLLCSLSSRLWNEVNYAGRRMFFEKKGVGLKTTYKEFYEKYRVLIGSATAQQVLDKNNEAWRSFFKLLKIKKKGRLPHSSPRSTHPGTRRKTIGRISGLSLGKTV
jgi:putative transposase